MDYSLFIGAHAYLSLKKWEWPGDEANIYTHAAGIYPAIMTLRSITRTFTEQARVLCITTGIGGGIKHWLISRILRYGIVPRTNNTPHACAHAYGRLRFVFFQFQYIL